MAPLRSHDVSTAVSSIIAAFHSLRDTVNQVRTNGPHKYRPKKKKDSGSGRHEKHKDDAQPAKAAQHKQRSLTDRLEASVQCAPSAIYHEYVRGLISCGDQFQKGDDEALASLAATLVKLNAGLVDFISSFLHHGRIADSMPHRDRPSKKRELDFSSLSLLAEASRMDACRSLTNLRYRLSQQSECHTATTTLPPRSSKQPKANKSNPPTASDAKRYIPRKSNQLRWAIVRTRPKAHGRKSATASNDFPKSKSQSRPINPDKLEGHMSATARTGSRDQKKEILERSQNSSITPKSPTLSGTTTAVSQNDHPSPTGFTSYNQTQLSTSSPSMQTIQPESQTPPVPPEIPLGISLPRSHRATDADDSLETPPPRYSQISMLPHRFASIKTTTTASTRLGEIPLHRWPDSADYDQISRLNAEAGARNDATDGLAEYARIKQQGRAVPRKGLFAKVFRKTPVADGIGA